MIEPEWTYDSEFEGEDRGCGDLLLDLQFHIRKLPCGFRIRVRTTDAGAPLELPAWCRMTRHELLKAAHPYYLILKK